MTKKQIKISTEQKPKADLRQTTREIQDALWLQRYWKQRFGQLGKRKKADRTAKTAHLWEDNWDMMGG